MQKSELRRAVSGLCPVSPQKLMNDFPTFKDLGWVMRWSVRLGIRGWREGSST